MIVGITGYAQHGKDSLGKMFEESGFVKYAFADALRAAVFTLNPLVPVGIMQNVRYERYRDVLMESDYETAKKNMEVRRLLQVMGTEVVRDILGEDTWVRALEKRWLEEGHPSIVITDVRFPNEAEWVLRNGGHMVRVVRPDFESGVPHDHPSEAHIEELPVKSVIVARDMAELRLGFGMMTGRESFENLVTREVG